MSIVDSTDSAFSQAAPQVVPVETVPNVDPIQSGMGGPARRVVQQTIIPSAVQTRNITDQVFKIVQSGTATVSVSYAQDLTDLLLIPFLVRVDHNLGFTPVVFVTLASSTASGLPFSSGIPLPFTNSGGYSGIAVGNPVTGTISIPFNNFEASVVTNNDAYFEIEVAVSPSVGLWNNSDYTFQYYLLQQSAL